MPLDPIVVESRTPLSSPRTQLVAGVVARASAMACDDTGVRGSNHGALVAVLCNGLLDGVGASAGGAGGTVVSAPSSSIA